MHTNNPNAWLDPVGPSLQIAALSLTHPAVLDEATRWSTGKRGEQVRPGDLAGIDLTPFVESALLVGAQAISAAGGVQTTFDLEALVRDVGERASQSGVQASETTSKAVAEASKSLETTARAVQKAITEVGQQNRTSFTSDLDAARKALSTEMNRLFGGESPELAQRLQPLLESFAKDLQKAAGQRTEELIVKASRQLDPADPTSPLARQQAEIRSQGEALAKVVSSNHQSLQTTINELSTLIKSEKRAAEERTRLDSVTPLKGTSYEEQVCAALTELATSLGEDFVATGASVGSLARCKKGDGVLNVDGGRARVVLEMSDTQVRDWNRYLDEAERNREAVVSLGLVPTVEHNGGHSLRVLGSRRLVLAYSPGDDPDLLRSTVLLLRSIALACVTRTDASDLETVRERLQEALGALSTLAKIRTASGSIRKNADTIDRDATALDSTLQRLLAQATTALEGAHPVAAVPTQAKREAVSA